MYCFISKTKSVDLRFVCTFSVCTDIGIALLANTATALRDAVLNQDRMFLSFWFKADPHMSMKVSFNFGYPLVSLELSLSCSILDD